MLLQETLITVSSTEKENASSCIMWPKLVHNGQMSLGQSAARHSHTAKSVTDIVHHITKGMPSMPPPPSILITVIHTFRYLALIKTGNADLSPNPLWQESLITAMFFFTDNWYKYVYSKCVLHSLWWCIWKVSCSSTRFTTIDSPVHSRLSVPTSNVFASTETYHHLDSLKKLLAN